MNTSEEILFSMNRYVEIYYDVKLSEEGASLEPIVQDLYSSNNDKMLREYWEDYSAALGAEAPIKKKTRRSKIRSSEMKQTKTDEATSQQSASKEDKPTSEAVSQEKPAKKLKVVTNKKNARPYRLKLKKSPEASDETIDFDDDLSLASAHSSQEGDIETFFRGKKIL